ncbi:hypothetical protein M0R45_028934 [Rubus argutus]|uniref:Ubiquitin-like domain-containing protein n=1 Tax=Rubus argutus TaxID=59490 RepID=A0AAW1W6L8_RUBAR
MLKTNSSPKGLVPFQNDEEVDWELRPGGMLVQRREDDAAAAAASASRGPIITIHVSHGSDHHVLSLPAHSTFGELKSLLSQKTGLEPDGQKLLFRGKRRRMRSIWRWRV